jgi:hypothetical protein
MIVRKFNIFDSKSKEKAEAVFGIQTVVDLVILAKAGIHSLKKMDSRLLPAGMT